MLLRGPRRRMYYTPCPHKNGAADFFTITFTNMHGFLWFLVYNFAILRCVPCTPLTWWRNVDVTEIMPFTVQCTWHCHHAAERDAKSLSLPGCGHPIRQIWVRCITAYGVSFKRGSTARGSMLRSWKSAEQVEAAGPHASSRQRLHMA